MKEPEFYLGAKLEKKEINGRACWTISSVDYLKAAIQTVKNAIKGTHRRLIPKAKTPMTTSYHPEMDGTLELNEKDLAWYQELIGILRWSTEIGRVDILFEVSILSQHLACPREGHLEQVLHIFSYLENKPKLTLYMDHGDPNIDYGQFQTNRKSFLEIYRDAEEMKPDMMPAPRGRAVNTTGFVDASHGANRKTRRSHTGFVLFICKAPIIWYSKRQQTVESSAFSSEFIAMRACILAIKALQYKLRMFGIPFEGPTHVFNDNESLTKNASKVESTLNKEHSSVAYHLTR